jgi:hypothetical protein
MSFSIGPATGVHMTPVSLTERGSRGERGFIDVFTTSPKAPWSHRFHFDGKTIDSLPFEVPTEAAFECLCMQAYVYYTSSLGRLIPNHCGYAYVCAGDGKAGLWRANFQDTRDDEGRGFQLTFRLDGGAPSAHVPFPEGIALDGTPVKDVCKKLRNRASAWYTSRKPLVPELVNVHVPQLPCPFPWLPGFFFAMLRPIASEDERLFQRALGAAASRRRWAVLETLQGPNAAVLVVEALAAIPNCFVYNEDVRIDPNTGRPFNDEAFYADERTIGNGDCEDAAHELVNFTYSLRTGTWTSPAVVMAQRVLLAYVVAEQLSGVNMEGAGSDVSQYRALPNDPNCSIFAHAFVLFLPATWVAGALQRGGSGSRLASWVNTGAAETLSADGIALFAARALAPFEASSRRFKGGKDFRLCTMSRIGSNYYKYVTSCMPIDSAVVCSDGSPVYELGYVTGDAYGSRFVDVINQADTIAMVPVLPSISGADDALLRKCATYFHPIAPLDASTSGKPSLRLLDELLGAQEIQPGQEPPETTSSEVYLQGFDALDERNLRRMGRRWKGRFSSIQYIVDYFAHECFMVHLFLNY